MKIKCIQIYQLLLCLVVLVSCTPAPFLTRSDSGNAYQGGGTGGSVQVTPTPKPIPPEVGVWTAEYRISDLDDNSVSAEDKLILSLIAGDVMFDISVKFKNDGGFIYKMNTDQMIDNLSKSISVIANYIISFDISLFAERLVKYAFHDIMKDFQEQYSGTYSAAGNLLTAVCGNESFTFRYESGTIVQMDADGSDFIVFKPVS